MSITQAFYILAQVLDKLVSIKSEHTNRSEAIRCGSDFNWQKFRTQLIGSQKQVMASKPFINCHL